MKQASTLFLGFTALISCLGASAASTPVNTTTVPVSLSQALSINVAQVPACAVSSCPLPVQNDIRMNLHICSKNAPRAFLPSAMAILNASAAILSS
jgi:hypothetical protein